MRSCPNSLTIARIRRVVATRKRIFLDDGDALKRRPAGAAILAQFGSLGADFFRYI